jgi:hypothetical protein|tara:strand:+ start:78 stop:389 length:312 start_codon:yes stop_codon:yes gene_type:complete
MDRNELNRQTAKISWKELEVFFANGTAIYVSSKLDLIDVGLEISLDNKIQIEEWMSENMIYRVSDRQAQSWLDGEAMLWSIVIKPWVLVQPIKDSNFKDKNLN